MSKVYPVALNIRLPKLNQAELVFLEAWVRNQLPRCEFRYWLDELLKAELNRRSGDLTESHMPIIKVTSGLSLRDALQCVRQLSQVENITGTTRAFLSEVRAHIEAMTEAVLELFDKEITEALTLRKHNTQVELCTPSEVCASLRVSESTLKSLVAGGSFPRPMRVGRKRFWKSDDIDNFFNNLADDAKE